MTHMGNISRTVESKNSSTTSTIKRMFGGFLLKPRNDTTNNVHSILDMKEKQESAPIKLLFQYAKSKEHSQFVDLFEVLFSDFLDGGLIPTGDKIPSEELLNLYNIALVKVYGMSQGNLMYLRALGERRELSMQ